MILTEYDLAQLSPESMSRTTQKKVCNDYLSGNGLKTLSMRYDISVAKIKHTLTANGIELRKHTPPHVLRELAKKARGDHPKTNEILERYQTLSSMAGVARELGVSPNTIRKILKENNILIQHPNAA